VSSKPAIEVILHWIASNKAWNYQIYNQGSKSLAVIASGECFDIDSVAREIRFGTTSLRYADFDLDGSTYRYAGSDESHRLPFWSVVESDPQDLDLITANSERRVDPLSLICIEATTTMPGRLDGGRSRGDFGIPLHRESIRRICGVCPIQMFDVTDPLGQQRYCQQFRRWATTYWIIPDPDDQKLFRIVNIIVDNDNGLAYDEVKYLHLVGGELKEVTEPEAYLLAKEMK
jgi:hypothetical protein